jgi:hypothetical protein
MVECRNPFQVKVDFEKAEQVWYYLGKTSTEARAQYTHDPAKKINNPKSNFLESVKPPPAPLASPYQRKPAMPYTPGYQPPQSQYGMYPGRPNYPVYTPQHPQLQQRRPERAYTYKPKTEVQPNLYAQHQVPPYPYGQQVNQWLSQGFQAHQAQKSRSPPSPACPTSSAPPIQANSTSRQQSPEQTAPRPPSQGQPSNSGFLPRFMETIVDSSQTGVKLDNSPKCPDYYRKAERRYSAQQPMDHKYAFLAGAARDSAGNATRRTSSTESNIEHLRRYEQYPYLRNTYLRRPTAYVSPYEPVTNGEARFSSRGQSLLENSDLYRSPKTAKPASAHPSASQPAVQSQTPRTGQVFQYQTPQQFQQQVWQEGSKDPFQTSLTMNKMDQLRHQLSQPRVQSSGPSSAAPGPAPYHPSQSYHQYPPQPYHGYPPASAPASNVGYPALHPSQSTTTPPHTGSPVRPEYSPITDAGTPKQCQASQLGQSTSQTAVAPTMHETLSQPIHSQLLGKD